MGSDKTVEDRVELLTKMIIGFSIIFLMTYGLVIAQYKLEYTDYTAHALWAQSLRMKNLSEYMKTVMPYPLWHFCVKVLESKLAVNIYKSAALITALFNGLTFVAVIAVWNKIHKQIVETKKMIFWGVCLFLVNPIYAPWINWQYYKGQPAPNVWHNPTHLAVRLFAVISFGLAVLLVKNENDRKKNIILCILYNLALILSIFAKPSFAQGFLPGVVLFVFLRLLIERKSFNIKSYLGLCLNLLIVAPILAFQFIAVFFNTDFIRAESHIGIAFGKYLYTVTPSMLGSFIISFAFPLWVLIFKFKELINKKEVQLMISYEVAAWLEAALLYEDASFVQGNFTWGYLLSSFIVWMVMLKYYLEELYYSENYKTIRGRLLVCGGAVLFTVHLLFGFLYWYQMFTGVVGM